MEEVELYAGELIVLTPKAKSICCPQAAVAIMTRRQVIAANVRVFKCVSLRV
jgi:hypothetical protein